MIGKGYHNFPHFWTHLHIILFFNYTWNFQGVLKAPQVYLYDRGMCLAFKKSCSSSNAKESKQVFTIQENLSLKIVKPRSVCSIPQQVWKNRVLSQGYQQKWRNDPSVVFTYLIVDLPWVITVTPWIQKEVWSLNKTTLERNTKPEENKTADGYKPTRARSEEDFALSPEAGKAGQNTYVQNNFKSVRSYQYIFHSNFFQIH